MEHTRKLWRITIVSRFLEHPVHVEEVLRRYKPTRYARYLAGPSMKYKIEKLS